MPTDIEIAQSARLRPIQDIAAQLGIPNDVLEPYGRYKAKLPLSLIDTEKAKQSKLILVSAISPTPAGEGKTTTSIGLAQGLNRIGKPCTVVLREPSLGPVFGMKGGATGGGWSQVLPMEDINLHFTGDFAAVEKAHNLLAALIDNNLQSKSHSLNIDPRTVTWKRVMDMNDRALRKVIVGLGGTANGIPRESGFDITVASEVMAILCLSQDLHDLKQRLGNIFIGFTYDKKPVYCRDLQANGAMAALLKDAIQPNLVQTIENTPAIIHGGPFANIAQGTNTLIATRLGLSLSEYVVTEAGFGFDLGGEKFFHIKSMAGGLQPRVVVLVATIRALKYHGGAPLTALKTLDLAALERGFANLEKHIENVRQFGVEPVVSLNHFADDHPEESEAVLARCKALGVDAFLSEVWAKGGAGATALAARVAEIADKQTGDFTPVYDWNWSVEDKIRAVATKLYGAKEVVFAAKAQADLKTIAKLDLQRTPVCMAKTQYSFSDNPKALGRPTDFTLTVREIEIAAGAGFVVAITGDMMRMPGLPEIPAANGIDITEDGNIVGLF